MANISKTLAAIDKSYFADDDSARLLALHEARALVNRLSKPHEFVETLIWTNPYTLLAIKIASDMGIFQALSNVPKTSHILAAARPGLDPVLVGRIMRMLSVTNVVLQVDSDTYIDTELSASFKHSIGPYSGIEHFWPLGAKNLALLPGHLQQHEYQNPTDFKQSPFSQMVDGASFWEYLQAHPHERSHFNSLMSSIRRGQAPWTSWYPLTPILNTFDLSTVLCVDVGGGKGADMTYLSQALPSSLQDCKIILQDLPAVLAQAKEEGLSHRIQVMGHDFFTVQPVKGAKMYFMHSICHDWPDQEAEQILSMIKDAMQPGYSKLLLYETVMPIEIDQLTPRMAAMDLNMMSHYAALERTEAQWKSLFTAVGLRWVKFITRAGSHQGIIEIDVSQ